MERRQENRRNYTDRRHLGLREKWGTLFRVSRGVAGGLFILVGIFLTISAFMGLKVFLEGMIARDYESATQESIADIADNFSKIEQEIEVAATLFSLSHGGKVNADAKAKGLNFNDKARQSAFSLGGFDSIIALSKNEKGKWIFQDLYTKETSEKNIALYKLKQDKKLLTHLMRTNYFANTKVKLLTDIAFFTPPANGGVKNSQIRPIAVVRALEAGSPDAGLVIGLMNVGTLMDEKWREKNDFFSRLTIREVTTGTEIFHLDRKASPQDIVKDMDYTFEFSVANRMWEVRAEYLKEDVTIFLQALPLFSLIFGFLLTSMGGLYLYGSHQQSVRTFQMNDVLEKKNVELKSQIVGRERLNDTLEKSERENRAILNSISDIIFETDTSGKILFLNAAWVRVTGFEPKQSYGLELVSMIHPQDQEKHAKDFQAFVEGKRDNYRSFARLRTSEGVFRAVELAVSMIRQDENKELRVVGTITDVEERRRAERALSEAEKKYRTIVENAAGGIFQVTPEGIYLSANPAFARIFGYENSDDLLCNIKNANEEIYVDMRERRSVLKELELRGVLYNHETEILKKDGTRIWVNENLRLVRDDLGNTLYIEGSMEDVMQRKAAEIGLLDAKTQSDLANRAKSEFLANMSHELRTPLNSIIGFSEIIKNESFGPLGQEAYKEYARDIHISGTGLLKAINEILDISKIEAGERYLNEEMLDIAELVDGICENMEGKALANKLKITNNIKDLPDVIGEKLALKQVFMNLVSNAIKFTPDGGRITLSGEVSKEGTLRVSLTDTGIGLDEAEIDKALSPFGQLDSALNRDNAGAGLGLTLVDTLMKLHGGDLEIFSQKGIGTTVTIIFPAERLSVKKEKSWDKEAVVKKGDIIPLV